VITGPVTGTNETAKTISDRSMTPQYFTGTVTAASGSVITIDTIVNKVKTSYTLMPPRRRC